MFLDGYWVFFVCDFYWGRYTRRKIHINLKKIIFEIKYIYMYPTEKNEL